METDQPMSEALAPPSEETTKPTALIIMGMAGSGKSTFAKRLVGYLKEKELASYNVNLDPAVLETSFPANVDIWDSVNYKDVMKKYQLGPNGAIMTSLNLFSTQFDQVVKLIETKKDLKYVVFDTPGQIEVFSMSASGQIITESLACSMPTVIVYVIDTVRCQNPNTFMSNILYALSIMYKTRLPMLLTFNKTDITPHTFATSWLKDYENLEEALKGNKTYLSSLSNSMGLVLEEFYT
jgi:GTPase SAR1 family protein